jgi:hypothetical protein
MKYNRTLSRNWAIVLLTVVLLIPLSLIACETVNIKPPAPLPTLAPADSTAKARPPLLIQYCADDTTSYRRTYFVQANKLIASDLQDAAISNQGGVTLFATAITHNTFDPANTLDPAFIIPATPDYGTQPKPMPTAGPNNPVFDPATATAVRTYTIATYTMYNDHAKAIATAIQNTKNSINSDAARLIAWNPHVDAGGASVLGCFQLAAARFKDAPSGTVKMLYIASSLQNTTDVDYTQNFVTSKALNGAKIRQNVRSGARISNQLGRRRSCSACLERHYRICSTTI